MANTVQVDSPAEIFDVQRAAAAPGRGCSACCCSVPTRPRPAPKFRCRSCCSSRRAPAAPVRVQSVLPHMTGGGVVHGPTPRLQPAHPKKMIAAALRGALSTAHATAASTLSLNW